MEKTKEIDLSIYVACNDVSSEKIRRLEMAAEENKKPKDKRRQGREGALKNKIIVIKFFFFF